MFIEGPDIVVKSRSQHPATGRLARTLGKHLPATVSCLSIRHATLDDVVELLSAASGNVRELTINTLTFEERPQEKALDALATFSLSKLSIGAYVRLEYIGKAVESLSVEQLDAFRTRLSSLRIPNVVMGSNYQDGSSRADPELY